MLSRNYAWAVAHEHGRFCGRYYFTPTAPHPSNDGCRIALFNTRREARDAKRITRYTGRVVKVCVTVEAEDD